MKLPLLLAALNLHEQGLLNLLELVKVQDTGVTVHRNILAILPVETEFPLASLLGLGLTTSANPMFNYLFSLPGILGGPQAYLSLAPIPFGFSDRELSGPIHSNMISARASASMPNEVLRRAAGPLPPIARGLEINAGTTRIVRDIDLGSPEFKAANKAGYFEGIRNDVAVLSYGTEQMSIAYRTERQVNPTASDNDMAGIGWSLARIRRPELSPGRQQQRGSSALPCRRTGGRLIFRTSLEQSN